MSERQSHVISNGTTGTGCYVPPLTSATAQADATNSITSLTQPHDETPRTIPNRADREDDTYSRMR